MEHNLKQILVTYTGIKKNPENNEVTVEMILDLLTDEFPELILPIAEENWLRGYEQAVLDFNSDTDPTSVCSTNEPVEP